jgi:hypothetical protein
MPFMAARGRSPDYFLRRTLLIGGMAVMGMTGAPSVSIEAAKIPSNHNTLLAPIKTDLAEIVSGKLLELAGKDFDIVDALRLQIDFARQQSSPPLLGDHFNRYFQFFYDKTKNFDLAKQKTILSLAIMTSPRLTVGDIRQIDPTFLAMEEPETSYLPLIYKSLPYVYPSKMPAYTTAKQKIANRDGQSDRNTHHAWHIFFTSMLLDAGFSDSLALAGSKAIGTMWEISETALAVAEHSE